MKLCKIFLLDMAKCLENLFFFYTHIINKYYTSILLLVLLVCIQIFFKKLKYRILIQGFLIRWESVFRSDVRYRRRKSHCNECVQFEFNNIQYHCIRKCIPSGDAPLVPIYY